MFSAFLRSDQAGTLQAISDVDQLILHFVVGRVVEDHEQASRDLLGQTTHSDDDAEMRFAGFKVFASEILKIDAVVGQQSLPLFNSLIQLLGVACCR